MVALIYDPIFLEHDTGHYHPEHANRLHAILKHIEPLTPRLQHLSPIMAPQHIIEQVHPLRHIQRIQEHAYHATPIDADTQVSKHSYEAALKAVGSGIVAVDAVRAGEASATFAAVRPPGHHATAEQAMGFCLLNSIAITARYAQQCGYDKVLIVDFDVHHGNGTQEIFYDDPTVFFFSSHQYPAYPGSGNPSEQGSGAGEGYTANFALPPESGDDAILPIYEEELPKVVRTFKPDIILVSAGYDLHEEDPLAFLQISTNAIGNIVTSIMESAKVPKLFFLEGGYHLEALGASVATTLSVMLDSEASSPL